MNILAELRTAFGPILEGLTPDPAKVPSYLAMIKPSQDGERGDYQANFAMPLAKELKKNPREIAAEVAARLPTGGMIESAEVAGPGFINLRLSSDWVAGVLQGVATDGRLGVPLPEKPLTVVIDYSGPNVAKPLHVGHLRSTIIGDSLDRLHRFLGHAVVSDNHLGDWGTQFGILLYGYKNLLDAESFEADPVAELARLYREVVRSRFVKKSDDDEGATDDPVAEACRQETVKLHAGDPENVALWEKFMPACMAEIHAIYDRLGVSFDHEYGESFYNPMLAGVVEDLTKAGIAEESRGAIIIRNDENNVSLIRKSDGAFTYTTTDLATIRYRVEQWQPDKILYVVDFRQAQHFANLFSAARRWGYGDAELTHVSYGSVLGADGRPMKTREGDTVSLENLLDEAVRLGLSKYDQTRDERVARGEDVPELGDAERREIAEAVGIGAVKYADLSQHRTSDYKFNYEKMLATDGNTATYMQYAYVRCRGIFRRGEVDDSPYRTAPPRPVLGTPHERALALQLLRFPEILADAAEQYLPHLITGYLWDLSKAYSGFFVNCPVLKAETPQLRESRLLLCDLTARVIRQALELLGIRTIERM